MKTQVPATTASPNTALKSLVHGAANHCFGCGQSNATGLRLKFFVRDDGRIVSTVKVPKRFVGPPGHVHGGVIATLLDEVMSKANRHLGVIAMTRHMEIDYLRPVPLSQPVTLEGHNLGAEGRKHHCEARLLDAEGKVLASARGLFIAVDPATVLRLQK